MDSIVYPAPAGAVAAADARALIMRLIACGTPAALVADVAMAIAQAAAESDANAARRESARLRKARYRADRATAASNELPARQNKDDQHDQDAFPAIAAPRAAPRAARVREPARNPRVRAALELAAGGAGRFDPPAV